MRTNRYVTWAELGEVAWRGSLVRAGARSCSDSRPRCRHLARPRSPRPERILSLSLEVKLLPMPGQWASWGQSGGCPEAHGLRVVLGWIGELRPGRGQDCVICGDRVPGLPKKLQCGGVLARTPSCPSVPPGTSPWTGSLHRSRPTPRPLAATGKAVWSRLAPRRANRACTWQPVARWSAWSASSRVLISCRGSSSPGLEKVELSLSKCWW